MLSTTIAELEDDDDIPEGYMKCPACDGTHIDSYSWDPGFTQYCEHCNEDGLVPIPEEKTS